MAFQVKSKSAEVIGDPSAQTALSLILYVMVNGFCVMPPLSSVGASDSSGEATKFPFRSRTIAYPSTCSRTEYQVHVADEHSLMGLTHSGHCSAPTTIEPPLTGFAVDVVVPLGVVFPPQAAATMLTTANTEMARATLRNLINLPPFPAAAPLGAGCESLQIEAPPPQWRRQLCIRDPAIVGIGQSWPAVRRGGGRSGGEGCRSRPGSREPPRPRPARRKPGWRPR